jgi:hypothetical protein
VRSLSITHSCSIEQCGSWPLGFGGGTTPTTHGYAATGETAMGSVCQELAAVRPAFTCSLNTIRHIWRQGGMGPWHRNR